jgi:hypothetical protein
MVRVLKYKIRPRRIRLPYKVRNVVALRLLVLQGRKVAAGHLVPIQGRNVAAGHLPSVQGTTRLSHFPAVQGT